MDINLERFCRRLNYRFKNPALLKQAISHCSVGAINNERMEFLGDSILGFVIANDLFHRFPQESEGQLSRLRAHLVKGEMLAQIALEIQLGENLHLGQGELKSGGFRRESILADALEAIFAAIFFDGGLDEAKRVILYLFQSRLADKQLKDTLKDAKTQLQEYLQSQKHPLPLYTLTKTSGEEHDPIFHIDCAIPTLNLISHGKGSNRRKAEQNAAKKIIIQLNTK